MLGCLFMSATIVLSVGVLGASSSASTVSSIGIESMCTGDLFAWTGAIQKFQSGVLVLDQTNHRIVVVGNDGAAKNQFGEIGQGHGDLLFPEALATDTHGRIYVVDHGSSFIKILSVDGQPITRFPIDTFVDSVTVNSRGHILANTPRKGKIVTVYSFDGAEITRFGALMPLDLAYPDQNNEGNTEHWTIPLSRAHVAVGPEDEVYVVFRHVPIVRKYSSSAKLLWERRMVGKPIDSLVKTFWSEPDSTPTTSARNVDGVQLSNIVMGVSLSGHDNLVVLLANSTLCAIDPEGRQLLIAKLTGDVSRVYRSMTIVRNSLVLVDRSTCYRSKTSIDF